MRVFPRRIGQQHRRGALRGHLGEKVNLRQYRARRPRNPRDEVEKPILLQFSLFKVPFFLVFAEILNWGAHQRLQ